MVITRIPCRFIASRHTAGANGPNWLSRIGVATPWPLDFDQQPPGDL